MSLVKEAREDTIRLRQLTVSLGSVGIFLAALGLSASTCGVFGRYVVHHLALVAFLVGLGLLFPLAHLLFREFLVLAGKDASLVW